ncbi:MAG: hypothetical protein GTN82_25900 [Candidatus Aminicenantes bacterium]|nr:hypothetical protein [Candidatus Aminicenantes bacterium]
MNKGNGHLRDLGWCYWTSAIYDIWKKNRLTFPEVVSREISRIPIDPPPNDSIQWPKHISIDPGLFIILRKFYEIEDSIVKGFRQLWKIAREEKGLPPQEYEHSLRILGDVLQGYDSVDESVITFFAVFDAIIKASSDKPSISNSCLRLKALVNDHTTDKMLISK